MHLPALLLAAAVLLPSPAAADPLISEGRPPTVQNVSIREILDGFEHPWGMAWLPDGALLVTERPGRLQVVRRDGDRLVRAKVAGVPAVFDGGQGGLLDVAVDPQFGSTRRIYLTYAAGSQSGNRTEVAAATFDGQALSDVRTIFRVAHDKSGGQHFGARIEPLPDGTLLVSIGDGGNPPIQTDGMLNRILPQRLDYHFGKVVRIAPDGGVPADNPFRDEQALPEIWSVGHRNIQGMARDPVTGWIWATEHGAQAGDELNLLRPGANYGWPDATYSRNYGSGSLISPHTSLPGMVDPEVAWLDTKAPSGLAVYRGDVFPDWNGDVLAGGLVNRRISLLDVADDGSVIAERAIPIGARVRAIEVGPDGHVYVLTDERNGRLLRLEPTG